jgi:mRNA-degrading endonuclease RelE of RelBE toxin-antitoxin system
VQALGLEPRPYGAVRVRATDYWRIRLGQLRVVYLIDDTERRVVIVRVARRSESTYRGLRDE